MIDPTATFRPRLGYRRALGRAFLAACMGSAALCLATLVVLLGRIISEGWSRLDMNLLTRTPSLMEISTAGVRPAIWGTIWLMGLTTLIAVPLGVGAAVYLEEYARKSRFTRFIHLNLQNLAGVPSIVYGILGLTLFVRMMQLGGSVLSGALTLSILVLPVVVISSREALAAVPDSIRQAAYALGATRWQVTRHHVVPAALPGILTGVILALSRAIGEAAPLVMIGAYTMISAVPGEGFGAGGYSPGALASWLRGALTSDFAALPIQIYTYAQNAHGEVRTLASATIVVLLVILLSLNASAVALRAWRQKHQRW